MKYLINEKNLVQVLGAVVIVLRAQDVFLVFSTVLILLNRCQIYTNSINGYNEIIIG